jgi:putative membrane protein
MDWIVALHLIFMVTWFAGLFYLPRLFVYHAMSTDTISLERFKVMERKLYYGIMTPGGVLTTLFGVWLLIAHWDAYQPLLWMHAKLILAATLWVYHLYCGKLLQDFKKDQNTRTHVFYRWLNEFPTLILFGIIILVVIKPHFGL